MGIKNISDGSKNMDKPLQWTLYSFQQFLEAHGFETKEELQVNPVKPQRAYTNVNNKKALSGYYAFYDNYGTPIGFASDYRTGQTHNFKLSGRKSTKINYDALEKFRQEAEEQQIAGHLRISEKAKTIWDVASPCDSHPYLLSKDVASHSLREHKGKLIIPIMDETGKLWSLQTIQQDGQKRFLAGGKTGGCFFIIGTELMKEAKTVGIGEGYATCMTIYKQKNIPMVVCFNAGNMLSVAEAIRKTER